MGTVSLESVRASCRAVADSARHVGIDREALAGRAPDLPAGPPAGHDPDAHHLGRGEETVAFFLTLDAVNFGSGWFPEITKRPSLSGYFTVATSLAERFRDRGPMTARELARATPGTVARTFGQDLGRPEAAELMGLFARAWRELGGYLTDRFAGSFMSLVRAADRSAESLVGLLTGMPMFRDEADYGLGPRRPLRVSFWKRAQIAVADLALAFGGSGPGEFRDLERLTAFADNVVPHVLRTDGVLTYAEPLARRIERGELIPPGSAEEVEIRASAVHAVERIVEELARAGRDVRAMDVDQALWNRGRGARYKSRPRHRTRCVYY